MSAFFADGADVSINLDGDPVTSGLQPLSVDTIIRVFETGTSGSVLPQFSIGSITVNGTIAPVTNLRLDILVGAATETAIQINPRNPVAPGVVNLGNASSGVGIAITDAMLRDSTRLALSVTGDTNGTIDVGHIFRFDVVDSVNGNVTARAANGDLVTISDLPGINFFDPIREFRAGEAIYGNVETVNGDIDRIIVFHENAVGIRGNIYAKKGMITSIWTGGPIGTVSIRPEIHAGDGIVEIIASTGGDFSSPAALTFNMAVDSRFDDYYKTPGRLVGRPDEDGGINRIRTQGDITGTIRAANLYAIKRHPFTDRAGIIADGPISADIDIDLVVERADIIGSTITGDIRIGRTLYGAVVATNASTGVIASLRSGFIEDGDLPDQYESYPPGFIGSNCLPVNATSASVWYGENPSSCPGLATGERLDFGSIDTVIRATAIGELRLKSMTVKPQTTTAIGFLPFVPRVESPNITTLQIDYLHEGVVWSGIWGNAGTWTGANVPENDYASIASFEGQCIGPAGAIWFQNCEVANIAHDVLGELHLSSLSATERLHIGGRLGNGPEFGSISPGDVCECGIMPFTVCHYINGILTETSPRDPIYADHGAIIIADALDLEGQVIINAGGSSDSAADLWKGEAVVDAVAVSPAAPITIKPTALSGSQPDLAPYYERVSGEVGDGAVGLAPFHLYETDCVPPHDGTSTLEGSSQDVLNGLNGQILVRFYGPIKKKNSGQTWAQHIMVKARPFPAVCEWHAENPACTWIDVTQAFNVDQLGTATAIERRTLKLSPKNGNYAVPGIYMVHPVDYDSIRCDDVTGNPPVVWSSMCDVEAEFEFQPAYSFVVWGDCDGDDVHDQVDCDITGCTTSCEMADFNHSGTVTVQDIFDFLAAYFTGCTGASGPPCYGADADVNNSGTISVQDIFDYLYAYFTAGDCE